VASPGREGATSHLFPPASDAGATTGRGELGYSVPTGLNIAEVEIAQARDLDVDSLPVWLSRTDFNARHLSQAERRFDCRPVGLALLTNHLVCVSTVPDGRRQCLARVWGTFGSPDAWIGVPYTIDTFVSVLQYEF
jgi:hypothetical protein